MISDEIKTDFIRTLFRAKSIGAFFHDRRHQHHHRRKAGMPDDFCGFDPTIPHDPSDPHDPQGAPDTQGTQSDFPDTWDFDPSSIGHRGGPPFLRGGVHGFSVYSVEILASIGERLYREQVCAEENPDAASETSFVAELQDRLRISKAAISQNLTALERKGLITRTVNPNDLRRFDFALTEKGERLVTHLRRHLDEHLNEALERMGERDTRELIRLFNKFIDITDDLQSARE